MDRSGHPVEENEAQNNVLKFLYENKLGRILLGQLVKPWVSKASGCILSSSCSKILIAPFVKMNKINMDEYESRSYSSYNDFFTRRIKEGQRVIDYQPGNLIAPCDGRLSAYPIQKGSRFSIKDTQYSLKRLLRNKKLANMYENGVLLLFRLTVDDYHRFCYIDNGIKTRNYHIAGYFHTVNPLANQVVPVYKENTREFSLLKSENFGRILIMEVGALLVGKIVNYQEEAIVQRGEEKGRFEFGGSTIIMILEKDKVFIDEDIRSNSVHGIETKVKLGEKIGELIKPF
jgi:Phosphatidylserine decarboxylase